MEKGKKKGIIHLMLKGGNRFYFNFSGDRGPLPEKEAYHAIKVCRKNKGDSIYLIDGKGKEFLGKISSVKGRGKKLEVEVEIIEIIREEKISECEITALIPLLKGDKSEFLIEKGTELGIHKFILYQSTYTIPKMEKIKITRYKEKALSALKQSGRLFLPEIEMTRDLSSICKALALENSLNLLASPNGKITPKELLELLKEKPQKIFLLSGPEGGFTEEEREIILASNFIEISLSPYILRAETASFALMNIVQYFLISDLY